jgi:viroplasmin and RNaseH domain-containing protein
LPYVITEPESIEGVCETWDECKSRVEGVKGAKYQKVHDEAEAQALLNGTGVVLKPGLHVFTDGNDRGGVGW